MESQRRGVTCPRPHSQWGITLVLEAKSNQRINKMLWNYESNKSWAKGLMNPLNSLCHLAVAILPFLQTKKPRRRGFNLHWKAPQSGSLTLTRRVSACLEEKAVSWAGRGGWVTLFSTQDIWCMRVPRQEVGRALTLPTQASAPLQGGVSLCPKHLRLRGGEGRAHS